MKMTRIRLFVLLGVLLAASVIPSHAGVIFQFNELGDLAYSLSGAPYVPMTNGVLEADPTGGVSGDVVVFNLTSELATFDLFNGDAPIGGFGSLVGDLRFTDPSGDTTGSETCGAIECLMIFYVFDSEGNPADVGGSVSTSFLTTQTPMVQLNANQFSYPAGVITYDGTIVPEPAPPIMLIFGLAALAFLRQRLKATLS